MPFYEYECTACKFYVEVLQKISDAPLRKCPSCKKQTLKKLVSAPVFRLKGGGWYETDFKSEGEQKRNLAEAEAAGADDGGEAKPEAKADDAKPDAAKDDKKPAETAEKKPAAAAGKPVKSTPGKLAPGKSTKTASRPAPKAGPARKPASKPAGKKAAKKKSGRR